MKQKFDGIIARVGSKLKQLQNKFDKFESNSI